MRKYLQAVFLSKLLFAGALGFAQDVETEEMICRDIGDILGLSPRTVNKHLEQVFKKMSVENRTSAASMVIRLLNEGGG